VTSSRATTQSATVWGMTPVVTYVMSTAMMLKSEDAEQELQDEERAAGRRTTQEHPHHTTYTR